MGQIEQHSRFLIFHYGCCCNKLWQPRPFQHSICGCMRLSFGFLGTIRCYLAIVPFFTSQEWLTTVSSGWPKCTSRSRSLLTAQINNNYSASGSSLLRPSFSTSLLNFQLYFQASAGWRDLIWSSSVPLITEASQNTVQTFFGTLSWEFRSRPDKSLYNFCVSCNYCWGELTKAKTSTRNHSFLVQNDS